MSDKNTANQQQNIIGTFERVSFPDLKVLDVVAKIDTGAYTGALHCKIIEERTKKDGKSELYFIPFDDPEHAHVVATYKTQTVKSSNGKKQKRFVIPTVIKIRGQEYQISLTLADRSDMKYAVLIGRKFLRQNHFIVDARQYKK